MLDRETLIVLSGVLIGTGSTIIVMANGWPLAASIAISGGVLLMASIVSGIRKNKS